MPPKFLTNSTIFGLRLTKRGWSSSSPLKWRSYVRCMSTVVLPCKCATRQQSGATPTSSRESMLNYRTTCDRTTCLRRLGVRLASVCTQLCAQFDTYSICCVLHHAARKLRRCQSAVSLASRKYALPGSFAPLLVAGDIAVRAKLRRPLPSRGECR